MRPRTRIITKGYDQAYGARPLRREIQNQIEDALAERMLQGSFEPGDTVVVDLAEDGTLSDRARRTRQASDRQGGTLERAINRAVSAR